MYYMRLKAQNLVKINGLSSVVTVEAIPLCAWRTAPNRIPNLLSDFAHLPPILLSSALFEDITPGASTNSKSLYLSVLNSWSTLKCRNWGVGSLTLIGLNMLHYSNTAPLAAVWACQSHIPRQERQVQDVSWPPLTCRWPADRSFGRTIPFNICLSMYFDLPSENGKKCLGFFSTDRWPRWKLSLTQL